MRGGSGPEIRPGCPGVRLHCLCGRRLPLPPPGVVPSPSDGCPLHAVPAATGSPGAPYGGGTTGKTSSTRCDPACCAGSYASGSSGACTPRKPALPIVAQLPSISQGRGRLRPRPPTIRAGCYSTISVTTPAPTVRPPSRMAKLSPSSIAIGEINSTFITVLSPGITISTPSSSLISPVTSVVRK